MKRDRQRARETARPRPCGLVLRDVRLALRVSTATLAESCGIPPATLSSYELGRRGCPDAVQVRIEKALHRFLDYAIDAAAAAEDLGVARRRAPRLRRLA